MKKVTLLAFVILATINIFATNGYIRKTFIASTGDSLPYRMLTPTDIAKHEKYPLVIFLHGSGERGSDNQKQLIHGSGMFENPVNQMHYPAFVIFPQCPLKTTWDKAIPKRGKSPSRKSPNQPYSLTDDIMLLIHQLTDTYPIDKDRIYLVGLSMGAMGVYDMVTKYPEQFAAAIPICGKIKDVNKLEKAKDVHFRIFHGDKDPIIPVKESRDIFLFLEKEGCPVEYIEYPGVGHDSWNNAFNEKDFMEWLFHQTQNKPMLQD